ncbi:uncharacterized protein Z519_06823 [Cladophialophora bantiana CBS 173.52]|uniref:CHAT domain-containing protein n=1 Tax=Cladophialophora bantiana (strain ATCC 10958 / CBS 173.52 / CDC B-1940 / NIH 8579) TaxID=1442370 RepID=A0A0D2I841_CLAB1|nr:uncharacterized protein Z519_06823 [Cladophialophora bantiana CBS 173.52]KIW92974.1 hypothetical protein Z519_06823 [Cladophialophora bantiana CBS 173.52]
MNKEGKSARDAIARSRFESNSGNFSDALRILREPCSVDPSEEDSLLIKSEILRVNLVQGDHRAVEMLDIKDLKSNEPICDLLRLSLEANKIWTDLDLIKPLDIASTLYKRYVSALNSETNDEFVVRIVFYCLVIRDWRIYYGEGLTQPEYQCDQGLLRTLLLRLAKHKLYFELLDAFEFLVDDPGERLQTSFPHLVPPSDPAFHWYLLCLARLNCKEGNFGDASSALSLLSRPSDNTSKDILGASFQKIFKLGSKLLKKKHGHRKEQIQVRKDVFRLHEDVIRQRYLESGLTEADRVGRLIRASKDLADLADFLSAFKALESAAELLNAIPDPKEAFTLGAEVHELLEQVCNRNGDILSKTLIELRYCDFLNSAGGDFALARKRRHELLELPVCVRMPYLQRYHHRQWEEYFMLRQREPALCHAERYLAYCQKCKDEQQQALAEGYVLETLFLPERASDEARLNFLDDLTNRIEQAIKTNHKNKWYKAMIEMQLLLVNVLSDIGRLEGNDLEEIAQNVVPILDRAATFIPQIPSEAEAAALKCQVAFLRSSAGLYLKRSFDENKNLSLESLGSGSSTAPKDFLDKVDYQIYLQQFIAAIMNNNLEAFEKTYRHFSERLDRPSSRRNNARRASTLATKAMLCYFLTIFNNGSIKQLWNIAGFATRKSVQAEALKCFSEVFSLEREMSVETRDLDRSYDRIDELIVSQAYLTSSIERQQRIDMCLEIATQMNDPLATWQWTQRGKARAFSDVLSAKGLRAPSGTSKMRLQQDMGFEDLRYIQSASASKLIFVDWISYGLGRRRLLLNVCRIFKDDCQTSQFQMDLDLDQLQQAASKINEARMDDSDSERYLRPFVPVIEPLEDTSNPGDILILSTTSPFHNVPLHAVHLGASPLIERNPIIYVPSQIALLSCLEQLAAPEKDMDAPKEWTAVIAAAYDDDSTDAERMHERHEIYQSCTRLAADLDATPLLGHALTTGSIAQQLDSVDVLHFHGHSIIDPNDSTKQCLALGPKGEVLTIGDISSLNLRAAHVTLMACSGGVQDFSLSGDEPLGLLSAFLLGGATSVIGALWPIQSSAGRLFTSIYYDYFLRHVDRKELGPIVNVARAIQHAVLEIKKQPETSRPYYWAPFICYGNWFCRRKPGSW